jgi:hypothetical protein
MLFDKTLIVLVLLNVFSVSCKSEVTDKDLKKILKECSIIIISFDSPPDKGELLFLSNSSNKFEDLSAFRGNQKREFYVGFRGVNEKTGLVSSRLGDSIGDEIDISFVLNTSEVKKIKVKDLVQRLTQARLQEILDKDREVRKE